jgi:hypothetical protein
VHLKFGLIRLMVIDGRGGACMREDYCIYIYILLTENSQ